MKMKFLQSVLLLTILIGNIAFADKMIIDDIPVGVEPEGMGLTNNGKILVN